MKQNIIIVLLSAICGILGYMAAQMQDRPAAVQMASSERVADSEQVSDSERVADSLPAENVGTDESATETQFDKNNYVNGGYRLSTLKPETNEKGIVKYEIYVNETGNADRIFITKSSGNITLDELIKKTAYNEKYDVKTVNGRPIKTFYKSSAEFGI